MNKGSKNSAQTEVWKEIEGHNGLYLINVEGQVRSISRPVTQREGVVVIKPERILKSHISNGGYHIIKFDGKSYLVHRLIAIAFIPNPNNHSVINHINGIKTDNRIENLEWCTHQHNSQHMHDMGLAADFGFDKNPRARKVVAFTVSGEYMGRYGSGKSAAVDLSVHPSAVRSVLCGRLRSYSGYVFGYDQ